VDKQKALEILERIRGRTIARWTIKSFIDHGKSAAVYRGENDEGPVAIKVFDTELIDKFGDTKLMARLERERLLLNHGHPNLVEMLSSGIDDDTNLHFLVMEFLPGKSLAECLEDVPVEAIGPIIEQIASAAKFLEDLGLAHRDIKPPNIVISPDFGVATLLDLGVLLPVGEEGLTDSGSQVLFVGTNQYASPEFAMRKEENNPDGWRAVTFYQLGGVLHDLITRTPLFAKHLGVPARLSQAVQTEVVELKSSVVSPHLVALAQNCLVKSPEMRLRLVNWDSFQMKPPKKDAALELRERIRQRASAAATVQDERKKYEQISEGDDDALARALSNIVQEVLRQIGRGGDPPLGNRVVYEVKPAGFIRCNFVPSERHGLPAGLTICLKSEALDVPSRVVRVQADSQCGVMAGDWCPNELGPVYEGCFDEQAIEEKIGLYVLTQVDMAQSAASGGES
jgi:serine/threonine protein kinase